MLPAGEPLATSAARRPMSAQKHRKRGRRHRKRGRRLLTGPIVEKREVFLCFCYPFLVGLGVVGVFVVGALVGLAVVGALVGLVGFGVVGAVVGVAVVGAAVGEVGLAVLGAALGAEVEGLPVGVLVGILVGELVGEELGVRVALRGIALPRVVVSALALGTLLTAMPQGSMQMVDQFCLQYHPFLAPSGDASAPHGSHAQSCPSEVHQLSLLHLLLQSWVLSSGMIQTPGGEPS